ncbi:hypothetical protein BHE74_00018181 [Ensete ventricosum]|nr:hypothetical protein BHE74_00018181 [Ensete ventricosum]
MGSLMAGWSSPDLDPETVQVLVCTVRHRRNRSLTKEEIEIYRRSHGRVEGEKVPYESRSAPTSPKWHQVRSLAPHLFFAVGLLLDPTVRYRGLMSSGDG